ncbi:Transcription initiation factor TFIID subunit 12 [Coemansia spiralis]|uniref:TBP-associated factor 12 n=2 Tax=Coemansia TaxID=4863 RepID=A0A9W8KWZ4_9FUNG|nr:transcription initiation factor TFIID subunit A-domain-containing protein [Coemansia spiralis]KAJ1991651.1 Transcription initiation factor TFIID subunit 12 [Coemansia umbellata]KAJ2620831.1 Transcription initiation factor TFIID subunit 12 [Coemansia sp. RSA 1358]KAJ2675242.1 Transcription initiation factor TFIID subunit 12 [Coemansia spiralis]
MAGNTNNSNSPQSLSLPSQNSPNAGNPSASSEKSKAKAKDKEPTTPISASSTSATNTGNTTKGKGKEAPSARESGIVLSPAMVQQMHLIIENHPVLKRDADNNVPFTNHMLDLIPVPPEFSSPPIENTAHATSYINAEASKIRSHLAVVQQIKDSTTDPDARRRLEKEVEALESHIKQVQSFMRMSFQHALSSNPATQLASFSAKDSGALKRQQGVGDRPLSAVSPSTPAATPLTPHILGTKQKASTVSSGMPSPLPTINPNATHVALSSALAHVATQSTRQSGPVDLDDGSRILTKRKIQELVSEIDPTERLEPEVEDILCDIADEFIESVTSFACQLAKHRKSDTLEAKDLQLHLERNWNIRIPGFASEEIRSVRKATVSQAHQERLSAITNAKNLRKFDASQ